MNNAHEKGRFGDSTLVHMNPSEVGGLAALAQMHGRQLTVNPETGYPEAFSLGDILPSLVGLGAAAFMPAASPWVIGGLTGATKAATTGSLEQGILSGLTAGGLSSLGSSLAAEGASPMIEQAGMPAMPDTAVQAGGMFPTNVMDPSVVQPATPQLFADGSLAPGVNQAAPTMIPDGALNPQPSSMMAAAGDRFSNMGKGIQSLMSPEPGGKTMGNFLGENRGAITSAGVGAMGSMALADEQARLAAEEKDRASRDAKKQRDKQESINTIRGNYASRGLDMPRVNFAVGGLADSEQNQIYQDMALNYMDRGLEVPTRLSKYLPQNNPVAPVQQRNTSPYGNILYGAQQPITPQTYGGLPIVSTSPYANLGINQNQQASGYTGLAGLEGRNAGYTPKSLPPQASFNANPNPLQGADAVLGSFRGQGAAAQANPAVQGSDAVLSGFRGQAADSSGIQSLAMGGNVRPPRMVQGPGDGLSDDIKTSIDGRHPAELSDGEFVIPADVVSHIGNGSSQAGARELYAMMDRIRKARTGTTKQAPNVGPTAMVK